MQRLPTRDKKRVITFFSVAVLAENMSFEFFTNNLTDASLLQLKDNMGFPSSTGLTHRSIEYDELECMCEDIQQAIKDEIGLIFVDAHDLEFQRVLASHFIATRRIVWVL